MIIELTTGNDSFIAVNSSLRRNVRVQTYVRTDEGDPILPMYEAYKRKLRLFRNTQLSQTIPATDKYVGPVAGQWYVNRHEVAEGTEILIEYVRRRTRGFGEDTEFLMLKADSYGPLYRIRLNLPQHELSSVPYIFFEGRFRIVTEDAMLDHTAQAIWRRHLGLDETMEDGTPIEICDILDPRQPEQFFHFTLLEPEIQELVRTESVGTPDGRTRVKIQRTRRVVVKR